MYRQIHTHTPVTAQHWPTPAIDTWSPIHSSSVRAENPNPKKGPGEKGICASSFSMNVLVFT
jgi:hypothetical protein